ncbi:MAG: CHAT domain-containing protein [Flavobacteriales bacterium]|nr:CHAT domain-containing protein [Flavobacteriales bacterium]
MILSTRQLSLFVLSFCSLVSLSQSEVEILAERQSLIDSLYSQEQYSEVIPLLEKQMESIKGTSWEDTLYSYCYNYARSFWKTEGVEAGITAAQRIIDQVELKGDPVELLHAYSDMSWIYYEVGQIDKCLVVDSIAMRVSDREGVPTHLKGRARTYMGFDNAMLGDYLKAGKYFKEARNIFIEIEPRDSLIRQQLAESSNGMAVAAWHLGQTSKAEKFYLEALDWIGKSEDLLLMSRKASTIGNLALMYEDAGDLTKCKEYYNENIRICNLVINGTDDPFLRDEMTIVRSKTYGNLASMYHSLGDYQTSKLFLDLADQDRKQIMEPNDPKRVVIKQSYADIETAKGNYLKAESLVREYLNTCLEHYGEDSEYTAHAYTKLAQNVAEQGRTDEANSLFLKSIASYEKISDVDSDPDIALTYFLRGTMNLRAGEIERSKSDLERSRNIYLNNLGAQSRKVAQVDLSLADVFIESGDYEKALDKVEEALVILSPRFSQDRDQPGITDQLPHLLPAALYQRVQCLRLLNNKNIEIDELGELETAIEVLQTNKTGLRDEESKLLLLGAQKKVFDLALELAYEDYQEEKNRDALQSVLSFSEKNKSILLKDRLNNFNSLSFSGVPDSIIELEHSLLMQLQKDTLDDKEASQRSSTESAYNGLLKDLSSNYPEYFELRYGDIAIDIDDLKSRLLNVGQQIVAYALTDNHIYATIIGTKESHLLRLEKDSLTEEIFQLNEALRTNDIESYASLSHELYQQLFEPIKNYLNCKELIIIPDEELYYLNFELLLKEPSTSKDYPEQLLINEFVISYLNSATTALQFEKLERSRNSEVLALAPGFSDELKDEYVSGLEDSSLVDQHFIHQIQQPFAVRTASSIGRVMTANVLLGSSANEEAFKEQAENYGVIHLGTHTEINNKAPLYSKLILSKSSKEDGYLHAYELYDMELKAELAVLTACQTGIGQQHTSEGMRSLAHSFAYAGCPSIVMSLWNIDEKSSSTIIEDFYSNLSQGQAKNVALRNAKLDFLRENKNSEQEFPFYWAGLVLVGDESPMSIQTGIPFSWILIGAGMLLALFLFYLARRQGSNLSE